uniref:Uncharacterized protein n=1 Tax=Arundo donax TaxID=35708 RepID=A0A0A9FTS3_ARUDO
MVSVACTCSFSGYDNSGAHFFVDLSRKWQFLPFTLIYTQNAVLTSKCSSHTIATCLPVANGCSLNHLTVRMDGFYISNITDKLKIGRKIRDGIICVLS